jgi:glycosyltransferase involved in cell wall biosynthesis
VRIVYLSGSGQLGGAERCLLDVLSSVRRARPEWELRLIASRSGPLIDRARALDVVTEVLEMPEALARLGDSGVPEGPAGALRLGAAGITGLAAGIIYRRRLRAVLKRAGPDVVHSNGYKMHVLSAWSRPPGSALIWHLHDYGSTRPFMVHAMKHLSRCCDTGIAVSESVARDMSPLWRGRLPIQVVLDAVDLQEFRPDGPTLDLDGLAGLAAAPAGTVRVGLLATMGRFKGHEVFLRAMAGLSPSLAVRGYVVGGSLYETRGSEVSLGGLRALASELGLTGRVGFTGFVADAASAMRSLDIVVHATTVPEPFGLVIAEGMACGRAVVASAAGGAGEIVRAGEDALVHAPGSVAELRDAIRRLVEDSAMRARLGRAGRRSAEARFNRDRLGEQVGAVYETVMTSPRAARTSA